MEVEESSEFLEGEIVGIKFGLATYNQIRLASISDAAINHASQLSNPFLGLPLEFGKCESCGATEPDKCEGHFGYIQLPVPIYHPAHVSELKQMLSLLCLKCLKIKKAKGTSGGLAERLLGVCCEEASNITIKDKTYDGASYLELKLPKAKQGTGCWNFLERYGYRYGSDYTRPLLAREVKEIFKKIPEETKKKLTAKGHIPQEGYILEYLPVPPNCLSVPEASDGFTSMSADPSRIELKDVLRKAINIKTSRSGETNFESHKVEANDMFRVVDNYLRVRGTASAARNIDMRYGVSKISDSSSSKAWSEKMRTLFIRKGSGFSSRSVITGDAYRNVNEVGIPIEIAQRITFEERVSVHNIVYLQELVDNKLCLSYTQGSTTFSLRDGSKGHTVLKPGQVVHRRVMDGDVVFINRPPTTHKHSLQALRVYVHEDNTVKINPLMCAPLSADFDGDCVHLFYPQSLTAKAEVMELFSVDKQLLSSHTGQLILQMGCDSLLSLKVMLEKVFLDKATAQQLAMYGSQSIPPPAIRKSSKSGPAWTAFQILQLAFPECLSCKGDKFLVNGSDLLCFDFNTEAIGSIINDIVTAILLEKGPKEALKFFDSLQPLLMEHLSAEGFSVSLEDLSMSKGDMNVIHNLIIREISPMVSRLRLSYEDELQLENSIHKVKEVAANFMLKSYSMRNLIDIKSNSAINKLVQQIGFLGLQLSDKKKFYTKTLVEDMAQFCNRKYGRVSASGDFGIVKGCFFHGLDPYEEMAHSISAREVIVRSSRGLAEPGTLFKNLMAVLRDIVIMNDGTVRNACSNSIVQFKYEVSPEQGHQALFEAGEPVGVLAATAMSNPAYKAVLDSTPNSNSSWELMKEVLLCKVNFQNTANDRRVILYLEECRCGKKYCQENAAYTVRNKLKRVSLKDTAVEFLVEYKKQQTISEIFGMDSCLQGHIHLNKTLLQDWNISMQDILQKCEDAISSLGQKKKKKNDDFKRTNLSVSDCCSFHDPCASKESNMPCLMFSSYNAADPDLERTLDVLCNTIYPVLLEAVIKGDPRISSANIIWNSPDMNTWIRNRNAPRRGEWVLDVTVEKSAVKQSGDAWRVVIDSCLSVLHLIDTKRSIPYSIKQVQELLGLSCAFEQAVQRLSSSVRMVSKGVLKEHIILLANNMTCSGNMLGFNSAGYKALTRSLNIKAPFTEATLIAPRKCFEKAAEKCHTDSLSTVVGSCSWGKRVDVGTGSQFELLLNKKETGLDIDDETDVYSFLQMVRSTNNPKAYVSSPGFDVTEEDMAEWAESPERDAALGELKFEDSALFQNIDVEGKPSGSSWDKSSAWENGSGGGSDWGASNNTGGEDNSNWGKAATADKDDASGWNTNTKKDAEESSKSDWGAWGKKPVGGDEIPQSDWGKAANVDKDDAPTGWNTKKDDGPSGWGKAANVDKDDGPSGWNTKKDAQESSKSDAWGSWGKKAGGGDASQWGASNNRGGDETQQSDWGRTANAEKDDGPSGWNPQSGWGSKAKSDQGSQWGASSNGGGEENPQTGWGSKAKTDQGSQWGASSNRGGEENSQSGWGQTANVYKDDAPGWNTTKKDAQESSKSDTWGANPTPNWGKGPAQKDTMVTGNNEPASGGWGRKSVSDNSWGRNNLETNSDSQNAAVWGASDPGTESNTEAWDAQVKKNKDTESDTAWGKKVSETEPDDGNPWVSLKETKNGEKDEKEKVQWGNPSKRFPSDGNNDWRGPRIRPPRPPETATRQRLDMFTSEEQDILSEVEPLVKTLQKIMRRNGYPDGEPISDEDKTFVVEKFLNFHPAKEAKIGSGVDFITIDKHTMFEETRCLFVVATDGAKQDFSYRKCLNNYLMEKYPSLAEEFIGKYFKKRDEGNRDRNNQNRDGNNQDAKSPGNPAGEPESQTQPSADGWNVTQTQSSADGWNVTQTQPSADGWNVTQTQPSADGWNVTQTQPSADGWNLTQTQPEVQAPSTGNEGLNGQTESQDQPQTETQPESPSQTKA